MKESASEVLGRAESLLRDAHLSDAIALLSSAADEEPDNLVLKVRLADYLRRDGQLEQAIALYRSCALQYADQGALPFAVALYKVLAPLSQAPLQSDDGSRPLLRELVQRYLRHQERATLAAAEDPALEPEEIPLFEGLSRDELEEVIKGIMPMRMAAGSVIFKEGDEGASLCIVTRGFVRVSSFGRDGQRIDLARLGPGEFFGEWSLLTGEYRRNAWVEAETDIELLELSAETIEQIAQLEPRVKEILDAFYRKRRVDTLLARVFPTLPSTERRRMAENLMTEESYPRGTIIFREGDKSKYMSIIQQGTVEVYTKNFDGIKVSLALLGPGQYFGEGSALSGTPRTATVRARTNVVLHHISREDLVTSLVHHPEILNSLQGVRKERLGATLEKLAESEDFEIEASTPAARGEIEEEAT